MMSDLTPEQIELLLAVSDGSLEGDDLARARSEIASDPVLAEELRLQEMARAHLATERVAPMADFEAARMRRAVLNEVLPQKPARTPWFARLVPAAAVLVLVVAGIGFLGNLTGQDAADLANDEIAAIAPTEKEEAATDARDGDTATAEAPAMDLPAADDALDDGGVAESDIAAAMPAAMPLPELGALGEEPLPDDVLEEMRAVVGGEPVPFFVVAENCDGVTWQDVTHLEVMAAANATLDGLEVLVVELPDGTVLVVDRIACEVVSTR